ncbi:MAG TPA: ABC transporter ATP-binding protein [Hyphomicrobiales bacterium]|nr:ABC transporter ATP-binding protein [Hyphomicrobiales bacterium]
MAPLLRVAGLDVRFGTRRGSLHAVRDVSLKLGRGETLCLVGESGSGKTTLSMALAGLLPDNALVSGSIAFGDREIVGLREGALRAIRGRRIGIVFQDASRSLNPVLTIGYQIAEMLRRHLGMARAEATERAVELLEEVGVNDPRLRLGQYPHELSGGLKQRVMIAIAIACRPELLIADEPTTALDVTVQRQILRLLRRLCSERDLALILVTHDFGVVSAMADQVAVMYNGRIVEYADVFTLFRAPRHPYAAALLATNPRHVLEAAAGGELRPIPGSPPNPLDHIAGCAFGPRCPRRHERCAVEPPLTSDRSGHAVACWYPSDA